MRGVTVVLVWLCLWTAPARALSLVTIPGGTIVLEQGQVVAVGAAGDQSVIELHPAPGRPHTYVVRRPAFEDATVTLASTSDRCRVALSRSIRLNVLPGTQAFVEADAGQVISVQGARRTVVPLEAGADGRVVIPSAWFPRPLYLLKDGFDTAVLVLPARFLDDAVSVQLSRRWFSPWPALLALVALCMGSTRRRKARTAALPPAGLAVAMHGQHLVGQDGTRYLVLDRIGQGGSGEVFHVLAENTGALLAAKVWFGEPLTEERLARFEREVRIGARLRHPGLVPVRDHGVYHARPLDPRPFLIEDVVSGQTLKAILRAGQPLPLAVSLHHMTAILEALGAAHAEGIVHRDLTPANIMVRPDGQLCIMDFGLASSSMDVSLTAPNAAMGTPCYMAPEQYDDCHGATAASDIYAAGIILYQMVTGRLPFRETAAWSLLAEKMMGVVPSVLDTVPTLPADLNDIIGRMTTRHADGRYATVDEVLYDVRRLGVGAPLVPVPDATIADS